MNEKDQSLITPLHLVLTVIGEEEKTETIIEMEEAETMITIVGTMTIIEEETLGGTTTITGEEAALIMGNEATEIGVTMATIAVNEAVVVIEMKI